MCDREAYRERNDVMSDEVLNEMGDRFVREVSPYVNWIKFRDYLNAPDLFDMAAAHRRNSGTILVVGHRIKLIEKQVTVH